MNPSLTIDSNNASSCTPSYGNEFSFWASHEQALRSLGSGISGRHDCRTIQGSFSALLKDLAPSSTSMQHQLGELYPICQKRKHDLEQRRKTCLPSRHSEEAETRLCIHIASARVEKKTLRKLVTSGELNASTKAADRRAGRRATEWRPVDRASNAHGCPASAQLL